MNDAPGRGLGPATGVAERIYAAEPRESCWRQRGSAKMIPIPAKITGMIVTVSMALFLTGVVMLCIVPLIQAMVEKRRPEWPALPPVMEYLGVAMALAGLTFRVTEFAAVGVGLALLGAWFIS